jgi:hypothetical protein
MPMPEQSRAPRRSFGSLLVAGAIVAGVALVVVAGRSRGPSTPERAEPEQTKVHIVSEPAGATVAREDDGGVLGVTPFEISLPKTTGELPVVVKLAGHQSRHTTIPLFSETGRIDVALVPVGVDAASPPKAPTKDWTP